MLQHASRLLSRLVFVIPVTSVVVGCGNRPGTLPSSVPLVLPDGNVVEAGMDSGARSLANTRWRFFRTAQSAQSAAFLTISFGPDGNLESFEDNAMVSTVFGSTIILDGRRHQTGIEGLRYAAAAYGAETADATGIAFEGRIVAFVFGIRAGNATAGASATFDPADPDVMRGTFSYSTRLVISAIPEANEDGTFPFMGQRITE